MYLRDSPKAAVRAEGDVSPPQDCTAADGRVPAHSVTCSQPVRPPTSQLEGPSLHYHSYSLASIRINSHDLAIVSIHWHPLTFISIH